MDEASSKTRLYWRCRRGMLELDVLLQRFLHSAYEDLDPASVRALESLLEYPDALLLELLMGRCGTADPEIARVIEQIRATPAT
ncbi:MAG: succinate dehydrogenase assembly factor 2 [Gammaproteobacteria bacterium]|nr:succinate dehydrogenase assembly factor 2 [Gammaproteobacteria bacterium]NIR32883.1 succinate dehydrogenase assembly factor 2 [Gammaproteobacteria bacterium]NIR99429.1 succinate dehydrogenase assembly factor 2 [Gammaproteobacteria bacterium]NIT65043.1 succinate dehydrogenase assembly factor 2 [Gammaproteobacteria bacterium]NIV21958.1 succinate dehydrogenase assembly factor 2 [Gammaproteobacteria bacterium]